MRMGTPLLYTLDSLVVQAYFQGEIWERYRYDSVAEFYFIMHIGDQDMWCNPYSCPPNEVL